MTSLRRLSARLEAESLLLTLFGAYVVSLFVRLPDALGQDGWLTLVGGREIARGGLPQSDTLTAWTAGSDWIDQQWLAQLSLYRLSNVGGLRLVMLAHAALLASALGVALLAARKRGGSARAVALVAAPAVVTILMSAQMRAQSFAYALFVVVLWLLLADAAGRRRRTLLVFPLLVLWANLHGSVVLGAALVGVYGFSIARRSRLRAGAFVFLPPACIFVSPYGLSLAGYYHQTAFNSSFADVVVEWGRATPSPLTLSFYLLGAVALWLSLRHRALMTLFEQAALALLFVAGVLALRNMLWFSYAAVMILPALLRLHLADDGATGNPRFKVAIAGTALAAIFVGGAAAASRPGSWYEGASFPPQAAEAVAGVALAEPQLGIYADVRFADWLLWREPRLAGRIAYDARFELLSAAQLKRLYGCRNGSRAALTQAVGNDRVVVVRASERRALGTLEDHGARRIYADKFVVVLLRGRPTS